MNARFLLAIMIIFLAGLNAYPDDREEFVTTASVLNMREAPDSKAAVVAKLPVNTKVEFIEETGVIDKIEKIYAPWLKVTHGGVTGYVFGGYVTRRIVFDNGVDLKNDIFRMGIEKFPSKGIAVNTECVLYELPYAKSNVVAKIPAGADLQCVGRTYCFGSLRDRYFWYRVKYDGKEGFVPGSSIATGCAEINGCVYGIREFPVKMEYPEEHRFIQTNSEILVFSKKKNVVVQRFEAPEITDRLSFIENKDICRILGGNTLIVNCKWNHFTCCPIGYEGNTVYALSDTGEIGRARFSWFVELGAQDEPFASLKSMKFQGNGLSFTYEYYDSIGLPELGHGDLTVKYEIRNGGLELLKIESHVVQTHQPVNGSYSSDKEHELKKPVTLTFDKDTLNAKFLYLTRKYGFLY